MTEQEMKDFKILNDARILSRKEVEPEKEYLVITSAIKGQLRLIKKEIKNVYDGGYSIIIRFNPSSKIYSKDLKIRYEYIKEVHLE